MTLHYSPTDRLAMLTFKAIRALKIDVPVLSVEEDGATLRLHLYGGEVVEVPTRRLGDASPPRPGRAPEPPGEGPGKKNPRQKAA